MRSVWIQIILLVLYLFLVFLISRMLDIVLWYQQGISSTQTVDPLLLSVRQLKHLLENRGVSYTGYVERKELAQLVEASATVLQGEVEELTVADATRSGRERLPTPPPPSHFSGGSHFYEEVEDTKDSVWLVQVVPASSRHKEPLLDDYSWRVVCNQVAPFAIRTGIFDCKLDRRLCNSKGWHQPLLLLALPKGTKAKDRVVLKTFTSTKPQSILEWVRDQLSISVKTIQDIDELQHDWLPEKDVANGTASVAQPGGVDVKVLLLTHLLHPPLFLAALSIKFTGRIKFGMFSVRREEAEQVKKRLKLNDNRIPSYLIITPEQRVVYGHRRFEHFNFVSMHLFLRAIQPEMNDVFLCSIILVNMLVSLQIFQVSVRLWWRHVARCLWTLVSYNFWLFSVWLVIIATYRFSLFAYLTNRSLIVVRNISLTNLGCLLRSDWHRLVQHPYLLPFTFFLYGLVTTWLLKIRYPVQVPVPQGTDRPWWEVLPVDSVWINCLFRPMASLSRPLPPSEVELEEGIEMLIERMAVPNLWLQPVVSGEYIKDLPVWKFRGWEGSEVEMEGIVRESPRVIERMMDGEEPLVRNGVISCCCSCFSGRVKHRQSSPCSRKKKLSGNSNGGYSNANTGTDSCSTRCCTSKGSESSKAGGSHEVTRSPMCPCTCRESARLSEASDSESSTRWGRGSEESGEESCAPPAGMRPTTECAVCLEQYRCGSLLCGLPCGHSYHQCCIMAWLGRDNHHCPVCRWPAYRSKQGLHRE